MKIELDIKKDTFNSFPDGTLRVENGENYIHLKISDSERVICVDKQELLQAVQLLAK